ncbi:MAG: PilN domain-containing protein [Pirellulales bacterium]
MKNIDFLPAEYRRQTADRKTRRVRWAVLALFAAVLAAATAGQFALRRRLQAELELVRGQHDEAVATGQRLAALQSEFAGEQAVAQLVTWLRHPWPRTRILAAALEPLPGPVTLGKLDLTHDVPAASSAFDKPARPPVQTGELKHLPPAHRDLARLRNEFDSLRTVVNLEGTTTSGTALHDYLGALAAIELFSKAELVAIVRVHNEQQESFRFHIRLIVRPGYGQPQGPAPQSAGDSNRVTAAGGPNASSIGAEGPHVQHVR